MKQQKHVARSTPAKSIIAGASIEGCAAAGASMERRERDAIEAPPQSAKVPVTVRIGAIHTRLFEKLTEPALLEDANGCIVDVNPAAEQALGWRREELLGEVGLTVYGAGQGSSELQRLRDACRSEAGAVGAQTVVRRRDGRLQPFRLTWLHLGDGQAYSGWFAVQMRALAEEGPVDRARRSARRQRDEFLAMLSHELRNPLAVIRNATQVLATRGAASDRCERVILRQVDHMASLLGALLDASRVTRGAVALERTRIDLREAARDALEATVALLPQSSPRIVADLPDGPVWVEGDFARLRQIQENLLSNAVKFTPEGGRVTLRLFRRRDEAVIVVADNGRGIAADRLEAIFELFVQDTSGLARSDGGMGLGLAVARSLVELHGGRVTVQSEGPGRGSRFEVRLPLDLRDALLQVEQQERSMHGERSSTRPGEARDILVVEDNADARETLQLLLELDGHRVRVAGDGEEGLAAIEEHRPQIAFVDIGLPRVDGFELARRVRARSEHAAVRLIALTGYGRTEDRRAIEQAGFDMHLIKPVSQEALRGAIEASST